MVKIELQIRNSRELIRRIQRFEGTENSRDAERIRRSGKTFVGEIMN